MCDIDDLAVRSIQGLSSQHDLPCLYEHCHASYLTGQADAYMHNSGTLLVALTGGGMLQALLPSHGAHYFRYALGQVKHSLRILIIVAVHRKAKGDIAVNEFLCSVVEIADRRVEKYSEE